MYNIIINGKKVEYIGNVITIEQIVRSVWVYSPSIIYTCTAFYKDPETKLSSGYALREGLLYEVKEGMIYNISITGNA